LNEPRAEGFRQHPAWLVVAGLVLVAQAGLALSLFGTSRAWSAVTDDRPILSGRHPLHLYHGTLGASSFRTSRTATCYDPAFQAGYPKTPVFDGGSRPAEVFALAGGREYNPAAYKFGVFLFVLFVPIAFIAAARGAGLPAGAAVLCGCLGMLIGWSPAVRHMLEAGQLDFLTAGLAAAVFVPWLGRYAKHPGVESWVVLATLAAVGWYAHPLVWLCLAPVLFIFYLIFAPRHGPGWHLGLAGITSFGIVPNAWWLIDWAKYWWLRQPSSQDHIPLPQWETVVGLPSDYANLCAGLPGGLIIPLIAVAGIVLLWLTHHRAAAALSVAAVLLAIASARLAAAWPRVPMDVPARVAPMAVAFLVPAAAFGIWETLRRLRLAIAGTVVAAAVLFIIGWADGPQCPLSRGLGIHAQPLPIGFTDDQKQLLAAINQHTTPDARILWDDAEPRPGGSWSPLLPIYTNRSYIGGLDVDSEIDHGYCALCNYQLNGRPLANWTDDELTAFCRWYNVGWVVSRSGRTAERWGRYPKAKAIAKFTDEGQPVTLFAIDRDHSFILNGLNGARAKWESADTKRIVLTDVIPDAEGNVDLSLHEFEGLRAYPSYVQLEKHFQPSNPDPIGHIRLRIPGPVPRITLVWEHP
jgi:hypothetical protein